MKLKLINYNFYEIKENINFYLALIISFLISLLLILHPSCLNTFNELGNMKWIVILSGIVGMTVLVFIGIFGYILLLVYAVKSIIDKVKTNRILSSLGTVFQFLCIVAMTWPIPMLVIRPIAKLYFNIIIPTTLICSNR